MSYGTVEFYKEQFADTISDAQADDPKYGDNMVDGFIAALRDWREYHANQVKEYDRLEQRVRSALTM